MTDSEVFRLVSTIAQWVMYTVLLVYAQYYLYRALNLREKQFHLVMYSLLTACCLAYLVEKTSFFVFTSGDVSCTPELICMSSLMIVTWNISYLCDCIFHLFFAVKYWALSHKLRQFYLYKKDEFLALKAYLISGGVAVYSVVVVTVHMIGQLEAGGEPKSGDEFISVLLTLPPVFICAVMIFAICNMRNIELGSQS